MKVILPWSRLTSRSERPSSDRANVHHRAPSPFSDRWGINLRNRLAALVLGSVVAGCSTTVDTRQALVPSVANSISVQAVEAKSGLSAVTPEVIAKLESAVKARLATMPPGTSEVKVSLAITEFDMTSSGVRFLIGAFAGPNRATVGVKVMDATGATIADFDVKRTANPGGYGAFYDQEAATINALADSIVAVLAGQNPPKG